MSTGTFIEDFKHDLDFVPVKGRPNVYSIHVRADSLDRNGAEMTVEEWDKFEKDVANAFECVR